MVLELHRRNPEDSKGQPDLPASLGPGTKGSGAGGTGAKGLKG